MSAPSLVEQSSRLTAILDYANRRNLPQPYDFHGNNEGRLRLMVDNTAAVAEWFANWPHAATRAIYQDRHELVIQFEGAPVRIVGYDHGQVIR